MIQALEALRATHQFELVWLGSRDAALEAELRAQTAPALWERVKFPGSVPLLAVETSEGELLVPMAAEVCVRVDIKSKRIDVVLPEGLRDLNRR